MVSVHDVEDGSVVGRDVSVIGEKEVVTCFAFCLGLVEIVSVAFDREDGVAR